MPEVEVYTRYLLYAEARQVYLSRGCSAAEADAIIRLLPRQRSSAEDPSWRYAVEIRRELLPRRFSSV